MDNFSPIIMQLLQSIIQGQQGSINLPSVPSTGLNKAGSFFQGLPPGIDINAIMKLISAPPSTSPFKQPLQGYGTAINSGQQFGSSNSGLPPFSYLGEGIK